MGFLSFSRPRGDTNNVDAGKGNKKARVSLTNDPKRPPRPSSCFIPSVVDDWLDDLPHKLSAPRRLQPLFRRNTNTKKTDKRTVPGTHPVGTPRTKMTGRRAVSTTTTLSVSDSPALPPGAAAPTLGHILDYSLDNKEYFSRPSVEFDFDLELGAVDTYSRDARVRRPRLRTQSVALDTVAFGRSNVNNRRPYSTTSQTMSTAPVVPPRSALRGSAAPSTSSSTATSSSSSLVPDAMEQRPYVLAVEPPTANFDEHVAFTAEPKEEVKRDSSATDEVISFRKQAAQRRSMERLGWGHPKSPSASKTTVIDERDPFKVRDNKPVRNSSSGVYTPASFPGPSASPTTPLFPASPTSPATSSSGFTSQVAVRPPNSASPSSASTGAYTAYPGGIYASGVCARAMSSFKRLSMAVNASPSAPLPPIGRPVSAVQYPSTGMVYTPPSLSTRSSMSHASSSRTGTSPPSSAHSVSPPVTPTTPSSYVTRNGVVLIDADQDDDTSELSPPLALDEPTPKQSPSLAMKDLQIKTVAIPVAERTVTPLSPTAPKRARRKPVPRLEDDDLVKRLEAVEV